MIAGEYAVLFDYPALVTAVDCRASTTLKASDALTVQGLGPAPVSVQKKGPDFIIQDEDNNDYRLFEYAFRHFFTDKHLPAIAIQTDTRRFFDAEGRKMGLGSSAAATVSLSAALLHFLMQARPAPKTILEHALQIHQQLNDGVGSGVDVVASVVGGLIKFQKPDLNLRRLPHWVHPDWVIKSVFTGQNQITKTWVKEVQNWSVKQKQEAKQLFAQVNEATLMTLSAMENQQGTHLVAGVTKALEAMRGLGLATGLGVVAPAAEAIHQMAAALGGSAKPSGAGGGDICLAVLPAQKASEFDNSLKEKGFSPLNWAPFAEGCLPLVRV